MQFRTAAFLFISTPLIPTVLANCKRGGDDCQWYGTSPGCGTTNFQKGQWDGSQWLEEWTKYENVRDLNGKGWLSNSCMDDYGASCVTGYKRLWCKKTKWSVTDVEGETVFGDQKTFKKDGDISVAYKHPHQKDALTIEIELK